MALLIALAPAASGCGRSERHRATAMALPVDVLADTGRSETLHIVPPAEARAWLERVTPSRPPAVEAPLPEAGPAALDTALPAPPSLSVDEGLEPPIPRAPGPRLVAPLGRRGTVEVDVRVDERGAVTDALWSGGSRDSMLVRAAIDCALEMKFYPALQAGRPVPVWCRQRFDFAGR